MGLAGIHQFLSLSLRDTKLSDQWHALTRKEVLSGFRGETARPDSDETIAHVNASKSSEKQLTEELDRTSEHAQFELRT